MGGTKTRREGRGQRPVAREKRISAYAPGGFCKIQSLFDNLNRRHPDAIILEPSFDFSYNEERVIIFSHVVKSKHCRQPIMKDNKQIMA